MPVDDKTRNSYRSMMKRCYDPKHKGFPKCGAAGIKVCDQWKGNCVAFFNDMGPKPDGKVLRRLDIKKDFSPENCEWSDIRLVDHNRTKAEKPPKVRAGIRIEAKSYSKTIAQWAEDTGMTYHQIRKRIKLGWEPDKIFSVPIGKPGPNKRKPIPKASLKLAIQRFRQIKLDSGCQACGYNKYHASLAFHHTKHKDGRITPERILRPFKGNLLQELADCCILCHNCHAEVHANITTCPKTIGMNAAKNIIAEITATAYGLPPEPITTTHPFRVKFSQN